MTSARTLLRYVRIATSVFFGVLCVLLIVLWVPPPKIKPSWLYEFDEYGGYIKFPHWFPILISGMLAAGHGLRRPYRFSLRTLLIATTVIAVVLGLVAVVGK